MPPPPPLHGVRVLEAARVLAGPFCGQLLADLGADVVKLERPGGGDDTRAWGPPFRGDLSAYFLSCNRNKRSVTLDIRHPAGAAVLDTLLAQSDVLLENFRTDSLPKLKLTPAALLARHPRLVVCSVSGFGRTGPLADAPGYDFAVQALSGLMGVTGPPGGPPVKVGVAVVDVLTGLYAATAVLAALHAREDSGHGYHIDLALHDCALAAQVNMAQAFRTGGTQPPRQGNAHLQIVPYDLFPTADGSLVLNVGNDSQWRSFCTVAEDAALGADPRYATNRQRVTHRAEVVPRVAALLSARPTAEWERRLEVAGVPHAVVRDYPAVFADEQVKHRGMALTVTDPGGKPVELVGSPFGAFGVGEHRSPPRLGADTDAVLAGLGLSAEQVAALRAAGVV